MHQPQEIEVWYVLPSIRREIAKELHVMGVSQVKISHMLGITKAAVSQYLSDKRAKKIEFPQNIKDKISKAAHKICQNAELINTEIQRILQEVRTSGLLCEYHKKYCEIKGQCTACVEE